MSTHTNAPRKKPGRKPPTYTPVDVPPDAIATRELVKEGVKNLQDAATFMGCGVTKVKELLRERKMYSFIANGRRVIPVVELRRYLEECADNPANR